MPCECILGNVTIPGKDFDFLERTKKKLLRWSFRGNLPDIYLERRRRRERGIERKKKTERKRERARIREIGAIWKEIL